MRRREELTEAHHQAWRDPAAALAMWPAADTVDPRLLAWRVRGRWWDVLEETESTLLVSREYEHLLLALRVEQGRPRLSFLPLPHPSGLAVDHPQGEVYAASTRNPNQVFAFRPAAGLLPRGDLSAKCLDSRPLVPVSSSVFPGSAYLHDLAIVGGVLHGNAVAMNAVARLDDAGTPHPVWWPRCVERDGPPDFTRNHLQLNGIAAGPTLEASFFTASADRITARKPGHLNWPVDRRGVLFSGQSREPVAGGLTRPHSPRFIAGDVWVDDSGYGAVSVLRGDRFEVASRLPGWTRGLCAVGPYAVAATSRVIPRFRRYAPGLDVDRSVCALHAIELETGSVVGSLIWPEGNQIFAIERLLASWTTGLPYPIGGSSGARSARARALFYAFRPDSGPTRDINEG